MIHIISYANNDYYENLRNRMLYDCRKFGLTNIRSYDRKWLETTQFYRTHRDILDAPRGGGFWAWKSFIMHDALSNCQPYDIVCYLDASTTMKVDPTPVIESVEDVLVCDSSWVNHDWVKRDAFHFMHCESDLYFNATQVWAGTVIVRNTEIGNDLVNDWLKYSCDRRIITDDPNVSGDNLPGYRDHRHDQSILTLLITKYIKEYEMTGVQTVPTMPFIDE
jgi:hypothetical protein